MTELRASLGRRLPATLEVGRGTALFLAGNCSGGTRWIRDLWIVANDIEHPVIAQSMPPLHTSDAAGARWWAIAPDPGGRSDRLRLGLRAHLSDGSDAAAELGEIELVARPFRHGVAHGNGSAAADDGGNGHRTWHPRVDRDRDRDGHTPPPLKLFRSQIDSIRNQTHENWVCVISDDASGEQHLRRCARSSGTIRAFASIPRRSTWRLSELRARARADARGGGVRGPVRPGRRLASGQARSRCARRSDDEAQLAYSDMRIVKANGMEISDTYWTERRNNHTNFASLLIANTVTGGASMFRREILDYALPFPQELPEQRHDHWLAIVAMARGDIAYVPRALYDYVQHGDAAIGHQRANQGASSTLAQRMQTVKKGGVLEGWGLVYYQHYRRLLLTATVLGLRFSRSAGA